MDRDAAGRARRVRFLLSRHGEVRGERKERWAGMRRAHKPSDKREMEQGGWPLDIIRTSRKLAGARRNDRDRGREGRREEEKENSRGI